MSDTPQVLLAHHLKALRLPTFLREYDKVVAPANEVDGVAVWSWQMPTTRVVE
jgi:hypothetical protein